MRIPILCLLIFVAFATATYLEDRRFPALPENEDDDSEIVIKDFNKCPKGDYFDIYTASCQQCTRCPKGKFAINECKVFDNTECASCSNRAFSNTRAYRINCRSLPVQSRIRIHVGSQASDVEVPWENIGESEYERDVSRFDDDGNEIPESPPRYDDDNESPELPSRFDDDNEIPELPRYADSFDDEYDSLYDSYDISSEEEDEEHYDPATIDAQIIVPAARPIIDQSGVLEAIAVSNEDFSDENSVEETKSAERFDEDSEEMPFKTAKKIEKSFYDDSKEEQRAPLKNVERFDDDSEEDSQEDPFQGFNIRTDEPSTGFPIVEEGFKANVIAWNLLTKFLVFIAYCFAVMSLFVAFRYAQNVRRQRTFNVQPIVMTPEQHNDLIRTVNYLQSKRRGHKYEPLEEFV